LTQASQRSPFEPSSGGEQGADFMPKVFIRLTNGVLELCGSALCMFCDTQIWRTSEDVLAAVRGL
jgi:hypothetical protein